MYSVLRQATGVDVAATNAVSGASAVSSLSHRLVDVAHIDVMTSAAAPPDTSGDISCDVGVR